MSLSPSDHMTNSKGVDSSWKCLYRVAGVAALLAVLVALTDIFLTFFPAGAEQPGTLTAVDWFNLFQENWFFGLRNLGLLPNILSLVLLIPVLMALYAVHRVTDPAYGLLALILSLLGTAIYLSNNAAFPMLTLSAKYAAATSETQKNLIIFSKATAYTAVFGGLLLAVFTIWSTFIPVLFEVALLLAMIGGLAGIAWYFLTARRFFQLGSQ